MNRLYGNVNWCGVAAVMLLLSVLGRPAIAAEPKAPDFQALVQELQKMQKEAGSITLLLWFPPQYWEACLANDARVTDKQKKDLVEALRPYTVIAVVDGNIGTFGNMTYKPEAEIRDKTLLLDAKGKTYGPLGEEDVQTGAKVVLSAMKPVMAGMLGPMGKNLHILLFPAADSAGRQIADAKGKGNLVVKLDKREFRWKLPLGSLLPAKYCTQCKEKCSGAWDFCPWCGSKLSDTQ